MNQKWVWENEVWPKLIVTKDSIMPHLELAIRAVAPLIKLASELEPHKLAEFEGQILLEETLSTSMIEKEYLDRDSVRSSIARHLGLPSQKRGDRRYELFTQVFFESIRTVNHPLTEVQLKKWHEMLFVDAPTLKSVTIGEYRDDEMSVVSGYFGRNETVHFKAPCNNRECVAEYMSVFMEWLNNRHKISDYLRAAFAKFWFVTIHPFDDGNGRLSRIIAERCLAEADKTDKRLYSLSTEIEKNKFEYYDILERCQKGNGDITEWVIWFFDRVKDAADSSMKRLDKIRMSTRFWDKYRDNSFNERQRKLLIRLFETDDFENGIPKRKYKNLVSTSDATAARDLAELVKVGALTMEGEGRAVKYHLNFR